VPQHRRYTVRATWQSGETKTLGFVREGRAEAYAAHAHRFGAAVTLTDTETGVVLLEMNGPFPVAIAPERAQQRIESFEWGGPMGGVKRDVFTPNAATDVAAQWLDLDGNFRLGGYLRLSAAPSGGFSVVDYVEFTATVSISATTEGTANTIVAGAGFTADGTSRYEIEFFSPQARPDATAAARQLRLVLFEGATALGQIGFTFTAALGNDSKPLVMKRILTPTAASHTYTIAGFVNAGTGAVVGGTGGAGNAVPGYVMVTKLA